MWPTHFTVIVVNIIIIIIIIIKIYFITVEGVERGMNLEA